MSAPNQYTNRVPATRLRQLKKQALSLLEVREKAEEDILVFIHEANKEKVSNAALAGMFGLSPSGIPKKASEGAAILAQRKGGKKAADG